MHRPAQHYRPSCFVRDPALVTARSPFFFDQGRGCGNAVTPEVWRKTVDHTPGCLMCERAFRAAQLYGEASCSS